MQRVVGLDLGGANLKAAAENGPGRSLSFALWKHPEQLADKLRELLGDWLPCQLIAVTMTAELSDCFQTKAEGVDRILQAVESIAGDAEIVVWQTFGEFVTPDIAREFPLLSAAANWHALATFLGRLAPEGGALLIDVGSTTTDIIPLVNGRPTTVGLTDGERLISGELVYSGIRRTPLCALAESVPFRGQRSRLAAELFATTQDIYLLGGQLAEDPNDCETANGRPATRECAYDRITRMLCSDRTEVTYNEAVAMAEHLADVQIGRIAAAVNAVLSQMSAECQNVVISGSGSWIAQRVVAGHERLSQCPLVRLSEVFSTDVSEAACAFAVARLAVEQELEWLGSKDWHNVGQNP